MAYGLSFQPGTATGTGPDGQRASVAPVQEAVRLLSLRLPSVVNRGLAPNALMQAAGGAGLSGPGGMSVDATIEWLRKQMLQSQTATPPQAQSIFQPPSMSQGPSYAPQSMPMPQAPSYTPPPVSRPIPQPGRPQPQPEFETSPDGDPSRSQYPTRTETRDGRSVTIVGPVPSSPAPQPSPSSPSPQPSWSDAGRTVSVSAGGEAGVMTPENSGFGMGHGEGVEDAGDPDSWMSPWERIFGRDEG